MNEMLSAHTGRSVEEIANDTERDYFMSSEEALEYGLIDQVVTRRSATEAADAKGSGPVGKE